MLNCRRVLAVFARRSATLGLAGLATLTVSCGGGTASDMGGMSSSPSPAGMDHSGHSMTASSGALTSESLGYKFSPTAATLPSGAAQRFSFQILDPTLAPQKRYSLDQTKLLHLYAVRRDLTNFQHVHPDLATDGTWSTSLNLANSGPYRVVADFIAVDGNGSKVPLALGVDLSVPGDYMATALPAVTSTSVVDGYQVELKGTPMSGMAHTLTFVVTQSGSGVGNLEPYLDAFGHLTAFRAGDLAYSHLHPAGAAAPGSKGGPNLDFNANLADSGDYRFFLQFQTAGALHTANFTAHAK